MKTWLHVILCSLAGPAASPAGLVFEKPEQSAEVQIADQEVGTRFAFKVTGDKPVTITDIRTYCSCIRAQTEGGKMVYQPGETGVIDTAFEVGSFAGEVRKELEVSTSDTSEPPSRLMLKVKIPALFEVTPEQLVWQVGEAAGPKTVRFKVNGDEHIKVKAAVSSRESMTTQVREIEPGREYEISVTPSTTDTKLLGLVRVETDSKHTRYQKRLVFFNITDKKRAGAAVGTPPAAPAR